MGKVYQLGSGVMKERVIGGLSVGDVYLHSGAYNDDYLVVIVKDDAEQYAYGQLAVRLDDASRCYHVSPSDIGAPGIGGVRKTEQKITREEAAKLLSEHLELREKAARKREEENDARNAKIKKGKEIFQSLKPSWAKGFIMAAFEVNTSDPYSDYFSSTTDKCLLLGFSKHNRDLFSEMRKFAALREETRHLAEGDQSVEHREKYSMGAGYYLGTCRYSGWQVYKYSIDYAPDMLYISLAEGEVMESKPVEVETKDPECQMTLNAERAGVELLFSEKPSEETRAEMKKAGFRWSSRQGIWYAKQSDVTMSLASRLSGRPIVMAA